jgi:hypothetical protein
MPQVHKSQYRENLGHLRKEENRMKLWVRSSDKMQLAEINNLSFKELIRGRWNIYGNYGAVSLGLYPTRERCIEIIDEIQYLLKNNGSTEDRMSQLLSGIENEFVVYEMPEE